jgi:hypothetical protein
MTKIMFEKYPKYDTMIKSYKIVFKKEGYYGSKKRLVI